MRTLVPIGVKLGVLFSLISWMENFLVLRHPRVSVFPGLVTLIALPGLVFLGMRLVARQHPGMTRPALRIGGIGSVSIAAIIYAVAFSAWGALRLSLPWYFAIKFGSQLFAMAFASVLIIGGLAALVVPHLLVNGQRGSR